MSILISGSRGFIASGLEGDGIDLKTGEDINTYEAKRQYDVVIHAAALTSVVESMKNPEGYVWVNVMGTLHMLKQHPEAHFIYLSTAGIYGEGLDHTVNSMPRPSSVYASTKLAGEYLVRNLAKSWCILRLTNVVGNGERDHQDVYRVFEREPVLPIYGDGMQMRDFINVTLVRATIERCARPPYPTGVFNIGSGRSKKIIHVAREFGKPMKFLPAREGEIKLFGIADAFHYLT